MRHPSGSRLARAAAAAAVSVLLGTLVPAAAKQQDEIPPLIDEVRVEVVNVDVVVTDAKGLPVSGLQPADFIVLEDGREREITNFFSFTDGRLTLAPEQEGATDAGEEPWQDRSLMRRMALLFDVNTLEKRELRRAVEGLEQFITEQFDGSYEWAVVGYDQELRLLQPFTSDKTTVLGALARIAEMPVPVRRPRASDPAFSEHPVIISNTQAQGRQQSFDQSGPRQLSAEDFEVRERMISSLNDFDQTVRAAVETMRAYSALPGRKSLVLVTGALETLPSGAQLLGFGISGLGAGERTDSLIQTLNDDLIRRYEAIVKTANASGFAIYPVSGVEGVTSVTPYLDVGREGSISFLQSGGSRQASRIDTSTTQQVLAAGTGGVYYTATGFYNAVDDIDNRTANAYVLGFQTDHAPDQEYHKVEVKLKHPGFRLQSREGYLHLSRRDRLVEELATPLLFPKDRGDFAVTVQVMPPENATKKGVDVTVAGVIPIDDVTLVPQGKVMVGRIFLFLAVYDEDGQLHKLVRQYQDLRLPAEKVETFPAGAPARFGLTVKGLERGDYTFTLTLMDEVSDRYGTGLQAVQL